MDIRYPAFDPQGVQKESEVVMNGYQDRRNADSVLKGFLIIIFGTGLVAGVLSFVDGHLGSGWFANILILVVIGIGVIVLSILFGGILWNISAVRRNRSARKSIPTERPSPKPYDGMVEHWAEVNRLGRERDAREKRAEALQNHFREKDRLRQKRKDRADERRIMNIRDDKIRQKEFAEFRARVVNRIMKQGY